MRLSRSYIAAFVAVWLTSAQTAYAGDDMSMAMPGAFGSYAMTREASGTSWQPESTPLDGIMQMDGGWMSMVHGYLVGAHDHQGGPRGDTKDFAESMFMAMAQRPLGQGTFGLRGMFSLDPLMGKDGYPLLLQTGETADGVHPLVDRQHPHDLVMELSASYSQPLGDSRSWFVYAGLPGEPALGPPAFMHRASGMDDPEAPLSHHWSDSTHVTFGVLTAGWISGDVKLEASAFHGREPDQQRWNIETGPLDSASLRLSWNPNEDWALQASRGYIHSPEQLEPQLDQHRSTASVMYGTDLSAGNRWDTTLSWGQDDDRPGHKLDAWLLESEFKLGGSHTLFSRLEQVQEDELFASGTPQAAGVYAVKRLSLGYIHDWPIAEHLDFGLGGSLSFYALPDTVQAAYGSPHSYMLFVRLKLH